MRNSGKVLISIPRLHAGQVKALNALMGHRFMALRCGRRFGKTEFAKAWIAQALVVGEKCAWFAPRHMMMTEVYAGLVEILAPLIVEKRSGVMIRLVTGGRLDFWSLENPGAGRSRGYHKVVLDEAAFGRNGDNRVLGSTMETWEKAIAPTLYDYNGQALACSNSAGKNPDNFFYRICTDQKYGFHEFHATAFDNPLLPKRFAGQTEDEWLEAREKYRAALVALNDPLVFRQEYMGDFVDWAGVAFFDQEKLLIDGQPAPYPAFCDVVFAVIDTASKTGIQHDGTAVAYFALQNSPQRRLFVLDWDLVQIEGATLALWLPCVIDRLLDLARACGARTRPGAFIEDKNSGTILLQHAWNHDMPARAIDSKLTAMGKDERAFSVSTYVHQGLVKYTEHAFNKVADYKQNSRNHLVYQVERFRIGDGLRDREDDLLDTFCYGIALSLGNSQGF